MFAAQHRQTEVTSIHSKPKPITGLSKPHNSHPQESALVPAIGSKSQACIQTKLSLGSANDHHEREADHVANQVMRMPNPVERQPSIQHSDQRSTVQRMCAECDDEVQRQTMDDAEQETLQAKQESGSRSNFNSSTSSNPNSGSNPASDSTASQIKNLRGGGKPLSPEMRAFFEPRFARDFSDVRIHTDTQAAETARSISAKAFTSGSDVVFAAGTYAPESDAGKHLLAHELTHVVQQSEDRTARGLIQRQEQEPLSDENFLVKLPPGGIHLKSEPYPGADNFPGDMAANNDVVIVKNIGGAATYNNVKNGTWSWIEIPGKSSPDPNYPVLHGFIRNEFIAGLKIGPIEYKQEDKPEPEPKKEFPESCPETTVDDAKVKKYIDAAIKHATVSGGWDVEEAFRFLQAKRCLVEYCCDEDLAAAEHYMFSRYMVGVEGYPFPVWSAIVLGYAGAKWTELMPSLCACPVTPTSWAQIDWALRGAADGEHDAYSPKPPP